MEIRIDTEKDSHEHIRKAISFLQTIVGDKIEITNSSEVNNDNGFLGMFNDSTDQNNETPSNEGSMFNIFNDEPNNNTHNTPTVNGIESFSLNNELTKQDSNDEEEPEEINENITLIPY